MMVSKALSYTRFPNRLEKMSLSRDKIQKRRIVQCTTTEMLNHVDNITYE